MQIVRPQSRQPLPENAKKVFQGILFSVWQWEQQLFDGSKATFEKIKRRDTVGVIGVTEDKKILLTLQEQPGIQSFFGTPGGIIDEGEDVFEAAKRELLEETGCVSDKWELFDATQPTTKVDWAIFMFLAKDCKKIQEQKLDPGEKLEVLEVSWEEFLDYSKRKEFRDTELALKIYRESTTPEALEKLRQKIFE